MSDVFHCRCLRIILGIAWRDHITNGELMKRAGMEDLSNIVRVRRLTIARHMLRLPPDRPANVAMQWEPDKGRRRKGRSRKTWRQTFQEDLQEMRVSWSSVRGVAVIGVCGKVSPPNSPAGVGGSKCIYAIRQINKCLIKS